MEPWLGRDQRTSALPQADLALFHNLRVLGDVGKFSGLLPHVLVNDLHQLTYFRAFLYLMHLAALTGECRSQGENRQ